MWTIDTGNANGSLPAVCQWLSVCGLFLAPAILSLTHAQAAGMAAEDVVWHGHSREDAQSDRFPGHDATDHAVPLHGLPCGRGKAAGTGGESIAPMMSSMLAGATGEGPKRPPRIV